MLDFFIFLKERHLLFILNLIFVYLLGSINLAIMISKIVKRDIRNLGSKNAGFTNALRTFGFTVGIITFLGDFFKGILAMNLSKFFLINLTKNNNIVFIYLQLMMLSCFLGHLFPVFFNFKGGKGILTSWAMTLILDWRLFFIMILIFILVVVTTKIVSLGSVVVSFCYPIVISFLYYNSKVFGISLLISIIIGTLIISKHKNNIIRILKKEEKKI